MSEPTAQTAEDATPGPLKATESPAVEGRTDPDVGPPYDPIERPTIGEVVVAGPPTYILADPALLAGWEDIQDGYLTAEAQIKGLYHDPIAANPSSAFAAGYQAYINEHPPPAGETIGPLPPGLPTGDPDELTKRILEFLEHGHDPHTEVAVEAGEPPPRPVFE